MRNKHIFFFTLFFIFCGFSLYYTSIFCIIYKGSSSNWLSDGFFGLFTDFFFGLFLIAILSFVRLLLMKFRNE